MLNMNAMENYLLSHSLRRYVTLDYVASEHVPVQLVPYMYYRNLSINLLSFLNFLYLMGGWWP